MGRQSTLSAAIAQGNWSLVLKTLDKHPRQARQWNLRPGFFDGFKDANVLPLHEAVVQDTVPYNVVRALVDAYPAALQSKESSYSRLPLHCACRKSADPSVIELLLGDATACTIIDTLGRAPLHYALSNSADESVVKLLLQFGPSAALIADIKGWLPLHVACGSGASIATIEAILSVYPDAVTVRTLRGNHVIRTINKKVPHREAIKEFLEDYIANLATKTADHEPAVQFLYKEMVFA